MKKEEKKKTSFFCLFFAFFSIMLPSLRALDSSSQLVACKISHLLSLPCIEIERRRRRSGGGGVGAEAEVRVPREKKTRLPSALCSLFPFLLFHFPRNLTFSLALFSFFPHRGHDPPRRALPGARPGAHAHPHGGADLCVLRNGNGRRKKERA